MHHTSSRGPHEPEFSQNIEFLTNFAISTL